jgi:hypothetical protein
MASPSVQRSALIRGPGCAVYDGTTLHAQEAITADVKLTTWRPKTATHGDGAPRIVDAVGEISFNPTGKISAAILAIFFPDIFKNPAQGSRAFPAQDKAMLIHAKAGDKLQFTNAALTGMPVIALTPTATAFGPVTFSAVIKDNTPRETAGAFYTVPASATWEYPLLDDDVVLPYSATWNNLSIITETGWRVTPTVQLNPITVDGIGTLDFEILGVSVKATCKPSAWTAQQLLTALRPEGIAIGSSLRLGKDLVITAAAPGGLEVTLYDAVVSAAPASYAPNAPRAGEITFEASRTFVGEEPSTTLGKLFDVTIVPEPEA